MMDSFLTVATRFKGRQSLSCNDLEAIQSGHNDADDNNKQLRKYEKETSRSLARPRFLRSKSHDHCLETSAQSPNRIKSKSSSELVNAVDCQLAEIREKLAMLRKQDTDFHERMDSLTNSIGELTSQSSFTPSETSDGMLSDAEDDNGDDKNCIEDDWIIQNNIKSISTSFSSEVLNSMDLITSFREANNNIPAIKITPGSYKKKRSSKRSMRRSDPSLHESGKPLNSSTEPNRHSTCLADYIYLYGSGEEVSTLL